MDTAIATIGEALGALGVIVSLAYDCQQDGSATAARFKYRIIRISGIG